MAEFYFKQPDSDRRITRNESNYSTLSSNKNCEFKIPKIPPKYSNQVYQVHPAPNSENSARQYLKPIGEKFEVIDKLKLIPIDEIKQVSSEFMQKLDALCMDKITKQILQNNNPAPPVVNDGISVFHTIVPQPSASQSSVRSTCHCQASACGSEIGYTAVREVARVVPPQASKQSNDDKVLPSEDENESIISFFRKNHSNVHSTKTAKKFVSAEVVTAAKVDTTYKSSRTSRQPLSRVPSVVPSTSSVVPKQRSQTRSKSVATAHPRKLESSTNELYDSALNNKVSVMVKQMNQRSKNSVPLKRKIKENSPLEPRKKSPKHPTKHNSVDVSITKESLRKREAKGKKKVNDTVESSVKVRPAKKRVQKENRPGPSKVSETPNEVVEPCGFEQTDRELFCDVSSIVGGISFQESPNNMLKNVTKLSNKNDVPLHFFSPFANIKSTSGVSAVSTPLSKTVSKNVLSRRLKKPSVVAELKPVKRKPAVKSSIHQDVKRLDEAQEPDYVEDTSDFSDMENTGEY